MFKFRKKKREKVNSIEQTQKDYVSNIISKDEYLKKLKEYAMIDKDKISFFWECFEKNIKDTLDAYNNLSTIKCRREVDLVPAFKMCYKQKLTLLKDTIENMSIYTKCLETALIYANRSNFQLKDIFNSNDAKLPIYKVAHIMMGNIKRGNPVRNSMGVMLDWNGELMFQNKINELPQTIPNLENGTVYIDDDKKMPKEAKKIAEQIIGNIVNI